MLRLKLGVILYLLHLQNSPSLLKIYFTSVTIFMASSAMRSQLVVRIVPSLLALLLLWTSLWLYCLSKAERVPHFMCHIVPLLWLRSINVATREKSEIAQDMTMTLCSSLESLSVSCLTFENWFLFSFSFFLFIKCFIHGLTSSSL